MADIKKEAKYQSGSSPTGEDDFFSKNTLVAAVAAVIGAGILFTSYRIRLMAINEFGTVIHEFDPYFNYRATEVSTSDYRCLFHAIILFFSPTFCLI